MRIMFVVLAGIVGWLWFATREAASQDPPPANAPARRADLSAVKAQVAAAVPTRVAAIDPRHVEAVDDVDVDAAADVDDARDGDLSGLMAQLEAAQQRANDLAEADTFDEEQLDETIGHEVIQIVGSAPIIDTTTVTHCGALVDDYTINIPTGRTFEGVLGAAADSQSQDYGVAFSSQDTLENVYVIDETVVVDEAPTEDRPVVEDHVIEPAPGAGY